MLVLPAAQHEPAKNHYQSNPNIGSHHYSTIPDYHSGLGVTLHSNPGMMPLRFMGEHPHGAQRA
jgi:hypothetical protein